jgi:hypothetical protein
MCSDLGKRPTPKGTPMPLPEDHPELAAVLDDEPDEAVLSAPTLDPFAQQKALYTAVCVGGPWAGTTVESRFPAGFLLVYMPSRKVWIYDLAADGETFRVREEEPRDLLDEGDDNRWRAANEGDYDIRVVYSETGPVATVGEVA